ncbi:MAG TPA: DUF1501 domain-containing protein [Pirellulales bacterium]
MARNAFCDGIKRRDFLRVGALGAGLASGTGLNLAGFLRQAAAGQLQPAKAQSAIYIRLGGGPTHLDTFDMKPDGDSAMRGELKPIKTNVPGVEFCECLPKLATVADKFTILRGVSHTLAAHDLGTKYLNTGNRPLPSLEYPGLGAVVSKELQSPAELPPFVAVPNTPQAGGFLGIQYGPFNTNTSPKFGSPFVVRGLALDGDLTLDDVNRRQKLLASVDTAFRGYEQKINVLGGMDEFSERAYSMISSKRSREAFDVSREPRDVAERFGESEMGQSCLLACRLVASGVRFVTVNSNRWDMHQDIFSSLREKSLPELDGALSALLTTLYERGLLDSTMVIVAGEFGRTPKINARGGRDHWPRAMFVLMAGGGVRGGQVIGASDSNGMGPAGEAITPDQMAASFYHALGIDYHKEYHTNTGRPVMIVRQGNVIPGLFG